MKRLITFFSIFALLSGAGFAQTECEAYFYDFSEELTIQLEARYFNNPWDSISGDSIFDEAEFVWEFMGMTETGNILTYTVDEPGEYEVCLTATGISSGCTSTYCETITLGIDPLEIEMETGYETEGDYSSGWAVAMPEGGEAPYTYLWSNGASTEEITGLTPGTYCVTVTDALENTVSSCISLIEDSTSYPVDSLRELFIFGFDYGYVENMGEITANVTAYIDGGEAPFTYVWTQEVEGTEPVSVTHGMEEANFDMVEGMIPGFPVFLTVTDSEGETAMGSIGIPSYEFYEDSITGEMAETVDSCLIEGELAMAYIEEYWVEEDELFVTWTFEFAGGESTTITVSYGDAHGLIEGIYEIILYLDCPDGMKSVNSFSDIITIDNSILSINDENQGIEVSLYPNPVRDVLTIMPETEISNARISITDAFGRVLESRIIDNPQSTLTFNTSTLPSGLYFVNIKTAKALKTLKFMK